MPRKYVGAAGPRYADETLQNAIGKVKSGEMSLTSAAKKYKIPVGTLYNKSHGKHSKSTGGQTRLDKQCETFLATIIITLAQWMVPITSAEIRLLVKDYLDKKLPAQTKLFKDNLPGKDWMEGFIKRHNLTKRVATKVKRARAELSPAVIVPYFEHLAEEIKDVPPCNIFNYDETKLTDDPGSSTVIVAKGTKRVEGVSDANNKEGSSLMFCGNAEGLYLPPMVVYKAVNCYHNWTRYGPGGAVYAANKTGWFNMPLFDRWFFEIFLPYVLSVASDHPFILIGDNLASHISADVIKATLDHNIKFITLPSSSTHICQPLDVAVFRPLKVAWGIVVDTWRKESRQIGAVPKVVFPTLLAKLYDHLNPDHLVSGFQASGICPLNPSEVLDRLPGSISRVESVGGCANIFNDCVLTLLQNHCGQNKQPTHNRGKKIKLEDEAIPGKRLVKKPLRKGECHCRNENETDDRRGDRWIQCEDCKRWFHLQCSGVDYQKRDYYTFDVKGVVDFECTYCV